MNVESIVTGVITGVLTGVLASAITGWFGVLFAFKQLRRQRAFDRQLDWYERTMRALGAVPHLRMRLAIDPDDPDDRTLVELDKAVLDLEQCASEADLYAEQSSWELLQRMSVEPTGDPKESAKAFEEVMRKTAVGLAKPARDMLGLKEIVRK